jgi:hypothetical protein
MNISLYEGSNFAEESGFLFGMFRIRISAKITVKFIEIVGDFASTLKTNSTTVPPVTSRPILRVYTLYFIIQE